MPLPEIALLPPEDGPTFGESPQPNSSDEPQVEAATLLQELRHDRSAKAFSLVMSEPHGRQVLGAILDLCQLREYCTETDPLSLAMSAGARNVGVRLIAAIEAVDAKGYIAILAEKKDQDAEDFARAEIKRRELARVQQ